MEQYPLILLDQHCASRRLIDDLCEKSRVQLDVAMETQFPSRSSSTSCGLKRALSIVPSIAIQEELENGTLAQVTIGDFRNRPRQKMGAIYLKGRYLSKGGPQFPGGPAGVLQAGAQEDRGRTGASRQPDRADSFGGSSVVRSGSKRETSRAPQRLTNVSAQKLEFNIQYLSTL